METSGVPADIEKAEPTHTPHDVPDNGQRSGSSSPLDVRNLSSKVNSSVRRFEQTLIKYHLEARGIQRVEGHEKIQVGWLPYLQVFLLWFSINLAASNVTLGMLGPTIYELSFQDGAICAALGSLLGSIPVAWLATWGPRTGLRTLAFSRYTMGWWPNKLIVVLNIIVLLGYAMIDCVVGGQILSAVSPQGSMPTVVGIIVVAAVTWVVTTFGISLFHHYERYAFLPQVIVVSILYGISAHNFSLDTPTQGNASTAVGSRLSFFSLCFSAALTYGGAPADFFVYYTSSTSPLLLAGLTLVGLSLSFSFAIILGVGLASGVATYPPYATAWEDSQGGSGSGALLVAAFAPLGAFGRFCAVVLALGLIANTIPPTYSSGIDFQILGRPAARIPRFIWNTAGVVIYTVCALAGRNSLAAFFTNFLALMGYWLAIWVAIVFEEHLIFRSGPSLMYDWTVWDNVAKLPIGIAALISFLVGWAGAILCMAQVWYTGPIAKLVGDYGADMGNYVGFSWAALIYPPLRWIELRKFKR